jgi:hypothetical protein
MALVIFKWVNVKSSRFWDDECWVLYGNRQLRFIKQIHKVLLRINERSLILPILLQPLPKVERYTGRCLRVAGIRVLTH